MKYTLPALVLGMASSHAAIIIDDFSSPTPGQEVTISNPSGNTGPLTSFVTGLPTSDTIGGTRLISVGTKAATGQGNVTAAANVIAATLTLSTDSPTIEGYLGVMWAGLNADLSSCQSLQFEYRNDQATQFWLNLVTFGSPGHAHSESLTMPANSSGTVSFPLSAFAAAGVNLADVDEIDLNASAGPGGDVSIQFVRCEIPEPPSAGLVVASLAGLGVFIFRRFRSPAPPGGSRGAR